MNDSTRTVLQVLCRKLPCELLQEYIKPFLHYPVTYIRDNEWALRWKGNITTGSFPEGIAHIGVKHWPPSIRSFSICSTYYPGLCWKVNVYGDEKDLEEHNYHIQGELQTVLSYLQETNVYWVYSVLRFVTESETVPVYKVESDT